VEIMLDRNVEVENKDSNYGQTPLPPAAENGHTEAVWMLLGRDANLDIKDGHYDQTPLMGFREEVHGSCENASRSGRRCKLQGRLWSVATRMNFEEQVQRSCANTP
jgi:hypothetical protein